MRKQSEHRTLCASRKSRGNLAARLEEIAKDNGALFRCETNSLAPRRITLHLTLGDHACMIFIDGSSRVDAFLGHWYTDDLRAFEYPRVFPGTGPSNYPHLPRRKATICEYSFVAFCAALESGLRCLQELYAVSEEVLTP